MKKALATPSSRPSSQWALTRRQKGRHCCSRRLPIKPRPSHEPGLPGATTLICTCHRCRGRYFMLCGLSAATLTGTQLRMALLPRVRPQRTESRQQLRAHPSAQAATGHHQDPLHLGSIHTRCFEPVTMSWSRLRSRFPSCRGRGDSSTGPGSPGLGLVQYRHRSQSLTSLYHVSWYG